MRTILASLLALGVAACATAMPAGGVATYDDLQRAQAACAAKGGKLTLKRGGDSQYLEDYACERT
ncbi:hypothetical protein [Phenylobacterium sp. J367]|uniref:hypothetical protein n=1 Tax=Phenylobacterium sp. J367 TaxID=2898435 RepID=UPI00215165FC|nr:hypothetical protein [Phenylobacterium sp. J367]MCR5880490.1 hypothetical protein [Phenylobacterium sp. J367]